MPTIERQGSKSVPYTYMYPRVIAGTCEFCGVMDNTRPSHEQYLLCPHFKNVGELRCSYCPEKDNPTDVINGRALSIHVHPENPGKLVVVCDSYNCSQKHLARFKLN